MTDIVKGVLNGFWPLIVGWILPSAVGIGLFGVTVFPTVRHVALLQNLDSATANEQALVLLIASVVIGLVLAGLDTPLYQILEGYRLWPESRQDKATSGHKAKRDKLWASIRPGDTSLRGAFLVDKALRYPADDDQIAPTALGNAIRSFEYYSYNRYCLDSQLMWYQLRAVAPESLRKDVDNSRAGVDFFVCSLYILCALGLSALAALFSSDRQVLRLVLVAVIALALVPAAYSAAVSATGAWAAAVQAMVDLGRKPLADAYGLRLPETIEEERTMWASVSWFLKFPYAKAGAVLVDPYRKGVQEAAVPAAPPAAVPAAPPAAPPAVPSGGQA